MCHCSALQGPQLKLHLGSFSFSANASVRGNSENDVVFLLPDEILQDGFITQGDPVLITQPADLLTEVEDIVFDQWHFLVRSLPSRNKI